MKARVSWNILSIERKLVRPVGFAQGIVTESYTKLYQGCWGSLGVEVYFGAGIWGDGLEGVERWRVKGLLGSNDF